MSTERDEIKTEQWMLNLVDEIAIQNLKGQRTMVMRHVRKHKDWKGRSPIEIGCEVENRVRSNLLKIVKSHLPKQGVSQ